MYIIIIIVIIISSSKLISIIIIIIPPVRVVPHEQVLGIPRLTPMLDVLNYFSPR